MNSPICAYRSLKYDKTIIWNHIKHSKYTLKIKHTRQVSFRLDVRNNINIFYTAQIVKYTPVNTKWFGL